MEELIAAVSQHEQLINIAVIVGITAVAITLMGFVLKTARRLCAILAIVFYATSAGFATKANTVIKGVVEQYVPAEQIEMYTEKIQDIDWKNINLNGESVSVFLEKLK